MCKAHARAAPWKRAHTRASKPRALRTPRPEALPLLRSFRKRTPAAEPCRPIPNIGVIFISSQAQPKSSQQKHTGTAAFYYITLLI